MIDIQLRNGFCTRELLAVLFWCGIVLASEAAELGDLASCDIINLQSDPRLMRHIGQQAFVSYKEALLDAFEKKPNVGALSRLSEDILIAQRAYLVEAAKKIDKYEYLNGTTCKLLRSLNEIKLEAKSEGMLASHLLRIDALLKYARAIQEDFLRRVRFRTKQAMELYQAEYACFAASLLAEAEVSKNEPPPQLETFGEAVSCSSLGRKSPDWSKLR